MLSESSEKLLMELLAIRLSEQTTLAKSLVMAGHPNDQASGARNFSCSTFRCGGSGRRGGSRTPKISTSNTSAPGTADHKITSLTDQCSQLNAAMASSVPPNAPALSMAR